MRILDSTYPTAAENLACDEALLDWREEGGGAEILRFWESSQPFVVVGYANKIDTEVNAAACAANNVAILRRCSGGGTVLQGPGCLSYALILRISEGSPLANISEANKFIMERNRAAVQLALDNSKPTVSVRGHTDLAIEDKKFSGNSQRRHKNYLLFHGTFLLDFDLQLAGTLLQMPSKQPDYRASRSHGDFLINLDIPAQKIKSAMKKVWNAAGELSDAPGEKIQKLAAEKYSSRDWNYKF